MGYTIYERQKLYEEVWTEPVTVVAKRYGMSDNGLRKHCKNLNIPLPGLGYWSKIKAGHKVPKTPLPKDGPEKDNCSKTTAWNTKCHEEKYS